MTRRASTRFSALFLAALALAAVSGCKPTTMPQGDSGTGGGGEQLDADVPDASESIPDAGEVDAGPPPELKITRVLPPRGGIAGGTSVLLEGTGFIRDFSTTGSEAKRLTTLKLGSNQVIDYQIIDDTTLELRAPLGAVGPVTISMTNPLGTFKCNSCFTYFEELQLQNVTPKEGPLRGGTEVTIDGQGFTEDVEVLFGTQSAPAVTLVSSHQLKVTTPRGVAVDLVDVTVYNKNGVGSQRRVFHYNADLRVTSITPATGTLAGGTSVTILGAGFTGATAVTFGALPAGTFSTDGDGRLIATTPPVAAGGAVDVTITTPSDSWTVKKGFTYYDPLGGFAIYAVTPHVARPGDTVTLTGQGLNGALTVSIGGVSASVGAKTFSTAVITVPARGAAPRKSNLVANAATLTGAFTWQLGVSSIAPSNGPSAGGTAATLLGTALPADAVINVGALPATAVTLTGETSAALTTPRGSGGAPNDVWVHEGGDPENEAVLPVAFTFDEPVAIGSVQPARGAIAGGTLVTVLGAGFGESTVVSFGLNKAKDVKIVDTHTLTCRTPKGDVGTVDVGIDRLGGTDLLAGGFSYYDPRSISGGLSGGPLTGTLNITVLDSTQDSYGAPVPLATVMLGLDPATPFQGLTDARGQLTFSDASLVKAQTVTVFKANYQSATVTAVNAENLTVFIQRTGGGSGNPSSGPPPPGIPASTISGRVTGFKAPRPLLTGETIEARVFVAQSSLYSGPPFSGVPSRNQEKWQVVVDGGEYLVFTGAGLRATYAVMGIANRSQQTFVPYLMGVKRGITTSPDIPAVNQDIVLDLHLDVNVPITIDSPLTFTDTGVPSPAVNSIYAWLDLGAEGFIPNPYNWDTGMVPGSSVQSTSATLNFPGFPHLDGSNFIFLNASFGTQQYPVSYYFRRQPGDMSLGVSVGPMLPAPEITDPLLTFDGTFAWNIAPTPVADIHDVQLLKPTLLGNLLLWEVVLPGSENQVVLPQPAVQKLRDEESGNQMFVAIFSSRSPKFAYNQWTYDTLSGVSWSSFTIAVSPSFTP